MSQHPALSAGRVAVITGAASGIGLAAAERFAQMGMKVCMADINAAALDAAAARVAGLAAEPHHVLAVATDVSKREDVARLKEKAYATFGEVAVLMNNAAVEAEGKLFADPQTWHKILDVNLWGVIHGVQTFGPAMIAQGTH
jgi:NAD(P)-dependent dehydrogenase (short-subunit alcohol dehydrogenase family)